MPYEIIGPVDFGGAGGGGALLGYTVFGDTTANPDVVPNPLSISAQSAYPQATVNTTGANLNLAGGLGSRKFTIVSNAALATKTITLTANGTLVTLTASAGAPAANQFGPVGTDDTAPQLAVTAAALAAAISAHATLGPLMTAASTGAVVYLTKTPTLQTLVIVTGTAGALVTATSGADGLVIAGEARVGGTAAMPLWSTWLGYQTAQFNTGQFANGVGNYALQYNTGFEANAHGYEAMKYNTGDESNGFGHNALMFNTGLRASGFGGDALWHNKADGASALGSSAGQKNTATGFVGVGNHAGVANEGTDNTLVGDSVNSVFQDNAAAQKTFDGANVNVGTQVITVTAHGFGANGTYRNLKFTVGSGGTVTGLDTGSVYQVKILSANTLSLSVQNVLSAPAGTGHIFTPQTIYSNATVVGAGISSVGGPSFTGVGAGAGNANTGASVTAIGAGAGNANTGADLTATGSGAAQSNTGANLTATGYLSAYQNTGANLTATGYLSAYQNTGANLTATGYQAAQFNTGANLTAIGYQAAQFNTGGYNITATGTNAALSNSGVDVTAVGTGAGLNNIRSNVSLLGSGVTATADNQVVLGNASTTEVQMGMGGSANIKLTLPAYATNAAAVAVMGAGKLYYTDAAGEYLVKISH